MTRLETEVTRTYLEMREASRIPAADLALAQDYTPERVENCSAEFYRELYRAVGEAYHWTDRLSWSDAQMTAYLSDPAVSVWVLREKNEVAGYFELRKSSDASTEIAYFGLCPGFIGQGLGKVLLILAIRQAWAEGAQRVWVHTCTLDHDAALPNYLKRGFQPYQTEVYTTKI